MGLVVRRRIGEKLIINKDCEIVFHSVNNRCVKVEINAPDHVKILRGELNNGEESIQETRS
jgi:carbon storage regulator CsrA